MKGIFYNICQNSTTKYNTTYYAIIIQMKKNSAICRACFSRKGERNPLAFVHEHLSIQCLLKMKTKKDYSNKHDSNMVSDPIQLRKYINDTSFRNLFEQQFEFVSLNSWQLMWHLLILSFRFFLFLVLVRGASTSTVIQKAAISFN